MGNPYLQYPGAGLYGYAMSHMHQPFGEGFGLPPGGLPGANPAVRGTAMFNATDAVPGLTGGMPGDVQDDDGGAGGPSGAGAPGGNIFSKIGGFLKGAGGAVGNYVDPNDPQQAIAHAMLLSNLLGTGAQLYGAYKQGQVQDQDRASRRGLAPAYDAVLSTLGRNVTTPPPPRNYFGGGY